MVKRIIDIIAALIGLLVLAPLMAVIAILVKLDSPGPVLYRGKRIGQYGRPFDIRKFRSMVADAPLRGASITCKDDPRVTRVGRILRRTKLDELPNLINVLRGEMSLVGPRPEAPCWVERYTPRQRAVLSVKPGITGLAQIEFGDEEALLSGADLETVYPRIMNDKLDIDLSYLEHWSLRLDARILYETGAMLLKRLCDRGLLALYARRIALDLLLVPLAFCLAWLIRFDGRAPVEEWGILTARLPFIVLICILINMVFGIYRHLWAYASYRDALLLAETVGLATVMLVACNFALTPYLHYRLSTGGLIMGGLLTLALSALVKFRRQLTLMLFGDRQDCPEPDRKRMLIVGIGETAQQLATQLYLGQCKVKYEPVGFIHQDARNNGMSINGLRILGTPDQIQSIVRDRRVDVIVIAHRPPDQEAMWRLVSACRETTAQVKILPDITQVIDGSYQDPLGLYDVSMIDILGRKPVAINTEACRRIVADKVVLVTGAAGSIGAELCRQVMGYGPKRLLALDNNETGLYDLNLELNPDGGSPVQLILADVTDRNKVQQAFHQYRPHVVFHAAAYKHVPLLEAHPEQAFRVNVEGTAIVSEIAHECHAERFVFISTDKAVNPTSVMGASKRIGELWIQAMSKQSRTVFTSVRFGNVVGSRGSVLPTFARQIEMGGPVTVTHPDMHRFFISISEAVSLVLQAATFSQGGEVFMLDMGDELPIAGLAERMIRLKGLRVHQDIEIRFTGPRPGEKLHEELTYGNEPRGKTPHPRIYSLQSPDGLVDHDMLLRGISILDQCLQLPEGPQRIRDGMFRIAAHDIDGFLGSM